MDETAGDLAAPLERGVDVAAALTSDLVDTARRAASSSGWMPSTSIPVGVYAYWLLLALLGLAGASSLLAGLLAL